MIPKEKIEQILENADLTEEMYPVVFKRGFRSGVQFAETELKQSEIDLIYDFALYLDTEHKNFIPTWIIDNFMAERQV